jgi:hypothetical protein
MDHNNNYFIFVGCHFEPYIKYWELYNIELVFTPCTKTNKRLLIQIFFFPVTPIMI